MREQVIKLKDEKKLLTKEASNHRRDIKHLKCKVKMKRESNNNLKLTSSSSLGPIRMDPTSLDPTKLDPISLDPTSLDLTYLSHTTQLPLQSSSRRVHKNVIVANGGRIVTAVQTTWTP